MTGDASQLTNLKQRPTGYVTYGDNNRGRILGVGDIGEIDKVIIKDVLFDGRRPKQGLIIRSMTKLIEA